LRKQQLKQKTDFNLSAISMGCSSATTSSNPDSNPNSNSSRNTNESNSQLGKSGKSSVGSPARTAAATPEPAATETQELRCTALGTRTPFPFPSQNKPFPEVYLALQTAHIGITVEGEII